MWSVQRDNSPPAIASAPNWTIKLNMDKNIVGFFIV